MGYIKTTKKKTNAGRKGKYTPELVIKICELLAEGNTVNSICEAVDITTSTYFEWLNSKIEFSDAIKKAKENQEIKIIKLARSKLIQKIEGFSYYEEVATKHGVESVKKFSQPCTTAIIFAIKNYENKIKEDSDGNKDAASMLKEIRMMITEMGLES